MRKNRKKYKTEIIEKAEATETEQLADVIEKKEPEQKKEKKTHKGLIIFVSILLALVVVAVVIVFGVYRGINIWAYGELGEGLPNASVFVKGDGTAEYVGNNDISLTEEGSYILTIDKDGSVRKVLLIVRDTTAPTAGNEDVKITIDDTITAEEALTDISEAGEYTVEWKTKPEFGKAGTYASEIKLEDNHGNSEVITVNIIILGAIDRLTHEAGDARPTIDDFMVVERDEAEILTDMSSIEWNVPGDYEVEIGFDGKTYTSVLEIVDTVAPVPDKICAATLKDTKVKAEAFTLGFDDATAVESKLAEEPDVSKCGAVTCSLIATDLGGNSAQFEAQLIVADKIVELEAANKAMTEAEIKAILPAEYAGYTIDPEASELEFQLTELGAHAVFLEKADSKAVVAIVVKDTTAPVAEGVECPCSTGYYCEPIKFVTILWI